MGKEHPPAQGNVRRLHDKKKQPKVHTNKDRYLARLSMMGVCKALLLAGSQAVIAFDQPQRRTRELAPGFSEPFEVDWLGNTIVAMQPTPSSPTALYPPPLTFAKRYSAEQIVYALGQAEAGASVKEFISAATNTSSSRKCLSDTLSQKTRSDRWFHLSHWASFPSPSHLDFRYNRSMKRRLIVSSISILGFSNPIRIRGVKP